MIFLLRRVSLEKNQARKRDILDKIKDIDEDININQHEVEKFLLIFHSLMQTVNSEEGLEKLDGAVTDAILQIILKTNEILKNNIDSLKFPEFLKLALK